MYYCLFETCVCKFVLINMYSPAHEISFMMLESKLLRVCESWYIHKTIEFHFTPLKANGFRKTDTLHSVKQEADY